MLSGSITAAAARLNVSQPSISKQIQLLEGSAGFTLFRRSGNRVLPTYEAEQLFERVKLVYAGLDDVRRFAQAIRDNRTGTGGSLTIAAMPLLAQYWLPPLVARLAATAGLSFSLPVRSTDWILRAAAAGRIDIGLCLARATSPGTRTTPLMELPFACVMRDDHPLIDRPTIGLGDLENEQVVELNSFDDTTPEDPLPKVERSGPSISVFTTAAACEIVMAGFGVAIVDAVTARAFARSGLQHRRVTDVPPLQLALVQPERPSPTRFADAVCQDLFALARDTEQLTNGLSS